MPDYRPENLESLLLTVGNSLIRGEEFPVTSMSKALARYLVAAYGDRSVTSMQQALDIGTGSGIHALLLAELGFTVDAIDIAERSITATANRIERFFPALREKVNLTVRDLSEIPNIKRFDVVVFNPPAYYAYSTKDMSRNPASGVFLRAGRNLMKEAILKLPEILRNGGCFMSTWAGLPKSLAENGKGEAVFPSELLQEWLGPNFLMDDSYHADPQTFFCSKSVITDDYGIGATFVADLFLGFRDGLYSRHYASPSDPQAGGSPSFRFGILHLTRINESTFRIVDTWSTEGKS